MQVVAHIFDQVDGEPPLKLKNGVTIPSNFPPAQDFVDCVEVDLCEVCPILEACGRNNCFDCEVYGMFDGFYINIKELADLCGKVSK